MLLKTSIYNHNFYPIQVIDIINIVRDKYKIHESKDFYVDDVSQNRLFLKPFQSEYFITNILPQTNIDLIDTVIYLDTTLVTDSYDYGTFVNITGQPVYIKKRHINVYIDKLGLDMFFLDEKEFNNLTFYDFELEVSLKDQGEIKNLLSQTKKINNDIKIMDFDLLANGTYGTIGTNNDECSEFARWISLMKHDDLYEYMTNINENIIYKVYYDEEKDDVILHIKIDALTLKQICWKLLTEYKPIFKEAVENGLQVMPIIQQPMGITATFNLTPNLSHPFLLNIKYVNGLLLFCNFSFMEDNEDNKYDYLSQIKNITQAKPQPSTLIPSKSPIIVNSYANYYYTDIITLHPYIARKIGIDNDNTTSYYKINNIYLENTHPNITIHHDTLPITKCIPKRLENKHMVKSHIYIDITNINQNFKTNMIIDYEINNETSTMKIPIEITPTELKTTLSNDVNIISDEGLYIEAINCQGNFINVEDTKNCQEQNTPKKIYSLTNEIYTKDACSIYLQNSGNLDCTINNIDFINVSDFQENYPNEYNELNNKFVLYSNKNIDFSKYVKITTKDIKNNKINNTNRLKPLIIDLDINRLKPTSVEMSGGVQTIMKINYNNNENIFIPLNFYNIKPIIKLESMNELNLLLPNKSTTLQFNVAHSIANIPPEAPNEISNFPIIIKKAEIIGDIENDEYFIEQNQFPVSLLTNSTFSVDFKPKHNNKLYNITIRVYTSSSAIPFFDIPVTFLCSKIVAEDYIILDRNDFFVRNNKYFLSLLKLKPKRRKIKIINTNDNFDFIIKSISFYSQQDKFGVGFVQNSLKKPIKLPYLLTHNNSITLDVEFIATDVGHFINFIVLETNFGQVQLPISVFCNTKLKDVFVLMENRRGVEFTAPLQGIDKDYIRLTNFGDEPSLIEMTKLSADKDEFYIENKLRLAPKSVNLIETLFIPTSSGQKLSYVDIKIKDMLETFRLYSSDTTQVFKLQNTHIIADMLGFALSQNAVPQFEKSVIDFGYLPKNNKNLLSRYDIFKIKNLGINPFIITKIIKTSKDSPFMIPLFNYTLPLTVKKEITLPIMIDNSKLRDDKNTYMEIFKFEIQDLKTKQIYYHEIIVKVQLSEDNREYFSFNSEYIDFGYCEINHFKDDNLIIKNFSTDKSKVAITLDGDAEFQTPDNFTIILQPSQTFSVPLYFFPHGIDTFNGTLKLNFNDGNYIKEIKLHGMGVDFKSPLIHTENKMIEYYKELLENYI